MSTAVLSVYETAPAPGALRRLRTVLVVTAVLCAATSLAYVSMAPLTADRLGEAVWGLVPGVVALALSRRAAHGRPGVVAGVVALAVVMLLLALVRVAAGEVQGITNLLLPTVLLVLVARPDVRDHLQHGTWYAGAPPRRSVTRALFRRGRAGEGGQATIEAVGVLAVAALVIGLATGALMSAPVQSTVDEGTEELVCTIQDSTSCGYSSAGGDGGDGGDGGGGGGDDDAGCSGFFACALSAVGQVGSGVYQVVDAAIDDVVGIFALVMDPSQIVDALRYLLTNPGDALAQLFWDAESRALWAAGDYGGAVGRLVWNVGSMFVPFANVAKVASALGDTGRLSRIAASAEDLADLASAGERAADAARLGNLDEAAEIAVDARRQADELAERARAAGCLSAGTVTLQVLAAGPVGGAAPVVVVAGGDLCSAAGDAARQADEAATAAERNVETAQIIGTLRDASRGKGNYGLGSTTRAQADEIGTAWVGPGYTVASDGKTLVSADGLRQYRPPSFKPNRNQWQANLETRDVPNGRWQGNGHLDIEDP